MMDSGGSLEAPDASRHHQVMSAQGEAPRVNGVEDVRPSGSHESGATGTTAGDGNQGQGSLHSRPRTWTLSGWTAADATYLNNRPSAEAWQAAVSMLKPR